MNSFNVSFNPILHGLLDIRYYITQCAVGFLTKQKRPKGLSIFLSKVVIGDLESVEKIIPQQQSLRVTS